MPQIIWQANCAMSVSGSPYVPNQSIAAAGSLGPGGEFQCQIPRTGIANAIFSNGPDCNASGSGDKLWAPFDSGAGGTLPDEAIVSRYRIYFDQNPVNGGDPIFTEWDYTTFPNWQFNFGGIYNLTPTSGSWDNVSGEFTDFNCCVDSAVHGFVSALSGPGFWQVAANRVAMFNIPATCTQLTTNPQKIKEADPSIPPYFGKLTLVIDYGLSGSSGSSTVYKRRYNVSFLHAASPSGS